MLEWKRFNQQFPIHSLQLMKLNVRILEFYKKKSKMAAIYEEMGVTRWYIIFYIVCFGVGMRTIWYIVPEIYSLSDWMSAILDFYEENNMAAVYKEIGVTRW